MVFERHQTEISEKRFTIINDIFSEKEINQIIKVIESIDTSEQSTTKNEESFI